MRRCIVYFLPLWQSIGCQFFLVPLFTLSTTTPSPVHPENYLIFFKILQPHPLPLNNGWFLTEIKGFIS